MAPLTLLLLLQQQVDHQIGVGVAPGRQAAAGELPVGHAVVLAHASVVAPVDRAHHRRRDPVVLDLGIAAVLAGRGEPHHHQPRQGGRGGRVVGGGGAGEGEEQGGQHAIQ